MVFGKFWKFLTGQKEEEEPKAPSPADAPRPVAEEAPPPLLAPQAEQLAPRVEEPLEDAKSVDETEPEAETPEETPWELREDDEEAPGADPGARGSEPPGAFVPPLEDEEGIATLEPWTASPELAEAEAEAESEAGPEPEPEPEQEPAPASDVATQWREKGAAAGGALSWFARLKERLARTKNVFVRRLEELLGTRVSLDAGALDELEEILIEADLGVKTTQEVLARLDKELNAEAARDKKDFVATLERILLEIVGDAEPVPIRTEVPDKPAVLLIVGVNGVGKTTTIGKIASSLAAEGKKVMLAAGDTFRAGAIDQLSIWASRAGVPIVKHDAGADAAAVVFDALKAARARGIDVLLIDTAGRLHTKFNLMEELKKVRKVLAREMPDAPHEILQVLDATTGQNAVFQARTFHEALGLTGLILTKLDGTAKGGIAIGITAELGVPIKLVGIGESIDDLRPFNGREFVRALFE